jgi:hypothetical protein
MFHVLRLILPVLIPSWRFFQSVEPSPRVQWRLTQGPQTGDWREFRPRPARLSPAAMALRLFWNPDWNEGLFLVSCAERIRQGPCPHSVGQIRLRLSDGLSRMPEVQDGPAGQCMQFRLVFVQSTPAGLVEDTVFVSAPYPP